MLIVIIAGTLGEARSDDEDFAIVEFKSLVVIKVMAKTERLYLNVVIQIDGETSEMLMDVTVSKGNSFEVNKMVFLQVDPETKEENWVVFPKKYYPFRLKSLKEGIVAEIKNAKGIDNYVDSIESHKYKEILDTTIRKMTTS